MKKIIINNFAAISSLELSLDKNLTVVIGAQASGKSTVSKLIYFCRRVKDYMLEFLVEPKNFTTIHPNEYYSYFLKYIRKQFMGCFGTTKHMKPFLIEFYYDWNEQESSNSSRKKMSLTLDRSGFVRVNFSKDLSSQIKVLMNESAQLFSSSAINESTSIESLLSDLKTRQVVKSHFSGVVTDLFKDDEEILYIPAGRSILATLSEQLHDLDVSIMDLPLQEFINLIQSTKKTFGAKIPDIITNYTKTIDGQIKNTDVDLAYSLVRKVLRGDYVNESDGEKLYYSDREYVKLMYASSGQQEVLWILLLIFIRILEQRKVFLVLEEPEAHLFPSAQKDIIELIALLINSTGSTVFITTHSPYILTSINLSVYSAKVENRISSSTTPIVKKLLRISPNQMDAFIIDNSNGFIFNSIKDKDEQLIDATQIDGISNFINQATERIMDLEIQHDM